MGTSCRSHPRDWAFFMSLTTLQLRQCKAHPSCTPATGKPTRERKGFRLATMMQVDGGSSIIGFRASGCRRGSTCLIGSCVGGPTVHRPIVLLFTSLPLSSSIV